MQPLRLVLVQLQVRRGEETPARMFTHTKGGKSEEAEEGRSRQVGGLSRTDPCDERSLPQGNKNGEIPVHHGTGRARGTQTENGEVRIGFGNICQKHPKQ